MSRSTLVVVLIACLSLGGAQPASGLTPGGGIAPVPGRVATGFDPPAERWGTGHRGVDLRASAGSTVRAPAAGVVSFAGRVAGRGVVVVDHGEVRSTLEPVRATVAVGRTVAAGDPVGVLEPGHDCGPGAPCLHWGLRRGEEYLDPLSLLAGGSVRLLPADAAAQVRERALARAATAAVAAVGDTGGLLARPVAGRVTSGFGRRLHPIFREWRLHAGVDLSAACGTPIRAAEDGVVRRVGFDASGGWRLVIEHPGVRTGLATTYLHAQGYGVRGGQRVRRGQVVGWVGSTGWSTGCHLHWSVTLNGRATDPERWW